MLLYFVAGPGVIVWDTPVREKQIERTKLGCVILRKDKTLTPSLDFRLKKNKSVRFVCWLCSRHSVPELWDRKGPSGVTVTAPLLQLRRHVTHQNCKLHREEGSSFMRVSLWSENTAACRIYRCKNFLFEQTNTKYVLFIYFVFLNYTFRDRSLVCLFGPAVTSANLFILF